ncbi:MAG: helix-turn-helix transcriptional regulator [Saprospiraceae bacterium]|nr:helix-turn-helix transcriptional regulator [Saprospiraceae bacterium]
MNKAFQNELRQKMRELRDLGGYSQKDLADAMEITQPSFFKIQNGQIKLAISHISGCAQLFCVTLTEYFALDRRPCSAYQAEVPPPGRVSERRKVWM